MSSFPQVDVRPDWFYTFTPDQQHTYVLEEQRGLHSRDCPQCKMKGARLFRCPTHRRWVKP